MIATIIRSSALWATLLTCALLGVFGATPALASEDDPDRWAIVVGANSGLRTEVPLRHAGADASRMAEVLVELGRVAPGRLRQLTDPSVEDLQRVLAELHEALQAATGDGEPTAEVVFFYSGHAGPGALHLAGERLPFERLRTLLDELPAAARLLIVDACRSGELTRVKGAVPDVGFELRASAPVRGQGLAILTSSGAEQDAQESDRLGGSFFTHHLVAGMRGAADRAGDGRVTLTEAYAYAYDETLRATSSTRIVQHPTFYFDMRGRRDMVLTHLSDPLDQGALLFAQAGHVLVFERHADGPLLAELHVDARPVRLTLPAGPYLVRHREADRYTEYQVRVEPGVSRAVESFPERRASLATAVRKGGGRAQLLGLTLGMGGSASAMEGAGASLGGSVGLRLERPHLTWQLTARVARGAFEHLDGESAIVGAEAELAALRFLDRGRWSLGLGPALSAGVLRQHAPGLESRQTPTARGAGLLVLQYALSPGFSLALESSAGARWLALEDASPARGSLSADGSAGVAGLVWFR